MALRDVGGLGGRPAGEAVSCFVARYVMCIGVCAYICMCARSNRPMQLVSANRGMSVYVYVCGEMAIKVVDWLIIALQKGRNARRACWAWRRQEQIEGQAHAASCWARRAGGRARPRGRLQATRAKRDAAQR